MADKFEDQCGVFGVFNHPDAANLTAIGLLSLQHRGQESAGIACCRSGIIRCAKATGTAFDLARRDLKRLAGNAAIGHVRYSTCGDSSLANAQPIVVTAPGTRIATCHNGNILNADALRAGLSLAGTVFEGDSDTEVVARLLAQNWRQRPGEAAIRQTLGVVSGAYSMLILTADRLYALRDPCGLRPLTLGQMGSATVISSETCALDGIGATAVRDVEQGELLSVSAAGLHSTPLQAEKQVPAQCIFELVYFARPDSMVFGESVAAVRLDLGRRLAREAPVDGDIVVPIPDSGLYGALGYARESGLPYEMALVRNGFVGRTFIEPDARARLSSTQAKYNPIASLVAGRRVVLVDDSIVRGSTCRHLVRRVRRAGAAEVHLRIASPPTIGPCFFGVDTPDEKDLFAAGRSIEEMRELLGADSLAYLSLDGLLGALSRGSSGYCSGCYSLQYPMQTPSLISAASLRSSRRF